MRAAIFASSPGVSVEVISRYDDKGPAWYWNTLTTTAINQQVTITVTYDPSQGQLNLNVLNNNGTPSATGTPSGNTLVVATNRLSIGHWFAQVTGATGVQANYNLDISVSP